MLTIKDLHASVADKPILNGINLEVNAGEVHAIMGNRSGKAVSPYWPAVTVMRSHRVKCCSTASICWNWNR